MSPDHAKMKMATYASYLNRDPAIEIVRHRLASTFLASWMKSWCRPPTRFSAVYFPCWVINADVQIKLTYNKKKETVNTLFRNTYLPGSHVPLLSEGELKMYDMKDVVPFTTDLLRQQEMRVIPIPYSASATNLLSQVLSMKKDKSRVSVADKTKELILYMEDLKINMFAAYPILMPVYIAEYRVAHKDKSVRMMVQAHEKRAPVVCEALKHVVSENDEVDSRAFRGIIGGYARGEFVSILMRDKQAGQNLYTAGRPPLVAFAEWLNMQSYEVILPLATGEYKDHDPLIRPLSVDEKIAIDHYMDLTEEAIDHRTTIEMMQGDSQTHQDLSDTEFDRRCAIPRWWLKHQDTLSTR